MQLDVQQEGQVRVKLEQEVKRLHRRLGRRCLELMALVQLVQVARSKLQLSQEELSRIRAENAQDTQQEGQLASTSAASHPNTADARQVKELL